MPSPSGACVIRRQGHHHQHQEKDETHPATYCIVLSLIPRIVEISPNAEPLMQTFDHRNHTDRRLSMQCPTLQPPN